MFFTSYSDYNGEGQGTLMYESRGGVGVGARLTISDLYVVLARATRLDTYSMRAYICRREDFSSTLYGGVTGFRGLAVGRGFGRFLFMDFRRWGLQCGVTFKRASMVSSDFAWFGVMGSAAVSHFYG